MDDRNRGYSGTTDTERQMGGNLRQTEFAVMTFGYNCTRTILPMINNCAPFVDRIYLIYSEVPWGAYNAEARAKYRNQTPLKLFDESPHRDKLEIVEGVWDTEEDARNEVLRRSRAAGYHFMILQDPDEFYLPEDYQANIAGLRSFPEATAYQVPWIVFWRNLQYVLEYRYYEEKWNTPYTVCPLYAVNLKSSTEFHKRRLITEMQNPCRLPGVCYHLSWVYSDAELLEKVSTWSHVQDFRGDKWYRWKWQGWRPRTRNLDHFDFASVRRAVRFEGRLPDELKQIEMPSQVYVPLAPGERLNEWASDSYYLALWWAKRLKRSSRLLSRLYSQLPTPRGA